MYFSKLSKVSLPKLKVMRSLGHLYEAYHIDRDENARTSYEPLGIAALIRFQRKVLKYNSLVH